MAALQFRRSHCGGAIFALVGACSVVSPPPPSAPPTASASPPAKEAPAAIPAQAPKPAAPAQAKAPPVQARPAPAPPKTAALSPKEAPLPPKAAPLPTKPTPGPVSPAPVAAPPLDLGTLEQKLKDTKAIGLMTKLTIKNQVDDLLSQFRAYHEGRRPPTLAELRRPYELLLMKILSLLQDQDPGLAKALNQSRESIWGVLSDRDKFAQHT